MAFNGSGVFQRIHNFVNDAAAAIKIRADRMDAEMDGMATGLSNCITKDGQTTITANLPMATFLHTGVGNATARNHYAAAGQVADGSINWVDGGGTADAITAGYAIPYTALTDGMLCFVRATAANATTTPTFSPSALTARTIVKEGGNALVAGNIAGDGHHLILRYNLTETEWELLNPAQTAIIAGDIASDAITTVKILDDAVTPAKIDTSVNIIGSIGGGTQDIDLDSGRSVSGTVDTSTTTFTFSNPKATGNEDIFTLRLTNGGSQTVNWPASVEWVGGTAPTLTTSGVDELVFKTIDGGTAWVGVSILDVQ